MFIAKNRNGPDGIIYDLFMDTSSVNIKMLPKAVVPAGAINNISASPIVAGPKEQREILKNKYDKFKKLRRNNR